MIPSSAREASALYAQCSAGTSLKMLSAEVFGAENIVSNAAAAAINFFMAKSPCAVNFTRIYHAAPVSSTKKSPP